MPDDSPGRAGGRARPYDPKWNRVFAVSWQRAKGWTQLERGRHGQAEAQLDAVFVDAEDQDPHTSMAIASIAVFGARRRPMTWVWLSCPGVCRWCPAIARSSSWCRSASDRRSGLTTRTSTLVTTSGGPPCPRPEETKQLAELMARVMSQRLDRDHPLWEYWVIEGLAQDRWALISKVHHCMVNSVSGTNLYHVILDFSPEPSPPAVDDRAVGPGALLLAVGCSGRYGRPSCSRSAKPSR